MKLSAIAKIMGLFLVLFSISMLPPILVNAIYHQASSYEFYIAFIVTFFTGLILWLPFQHYHIELKVRDGFIVVVMFWIGLSLFGCLPYLLTHVINLSFTDALFESISGLTTTGSTILTHIDTLPNALRFYRQEEQFIGGMGIIVLAVAVLPMLGIGGMQLFRAETPGPIKDVKLTPRIQETAKTLWYIYVGFVLVCMLCYWFAGMSFFDALGESFATISTGGFSMHDASFGYYESPTLNLIAIFFMLLSSINFALHYTVLQKKSLLTYFRDVECRTYLIMVTCIFLIVFSILAWHHYYESEFDVFTDSLFDVVSIVSTTGFTSSSFAYWPSFLPILMMVGGIIGGCAASTAGGLKVVRFILLNKQGIREIHKLIHPKAIFTIKFGKRVLPEAVVEAIWGYIAVFIFVFVIMILILSANGLNLETAFGATVASVGNVGAGISAVAENCSQLNNVCKWVLMAGMLLGRLEIFTVLVLLSPVFWRR